ncbi:MAG: prephenate dehydratase domain-containing protein, partial [Acidobacteriota bacterium]
GVLLSGFASVRDAVEEVRTCRADLALLPIENSTAGSINETYDLLAEGGLTINAEVVSKVEHCLITLPGAKLDQLRRVISHPQALMQCETYLRSLPWVRSLAEFDTAGAARKVRESNDPTLAAIASEGAAKMLGLEVLRRGIQSQPSNSTRFVEVAIEAAESPGDRDHKTSLLVILERNAVTLGEVLMAFGRRGIDVAKLESRPIPETPFRYRFYLDVEAHASDQLMQEAMEEARALTGELRQLGTYPRAD